MLDVPQFLARRHFPELDDLESLIESFGDKARTNKVAEVTHADKTYPLYSVVIGSADPSAPALGLFGGAHGLEKIGSEVILAYMHVLQEFLRWDKVNTEALKHSRVVFMPIINPVGIVSRTRSNGNGVDIIRNSPLDAEEPGGQVYRGHRISNTLPWYRGDAGAAMEIETRALLEVVEKELLPSRRSIAVDVHSGFGAKDRFWFPYSHSRRPFPNLAEAYALKGLFDLTYPNHVYAFEPMSRQYTIHGDPWDYLFEENRKRKDHGFFLPFTLEMGSWAWLRKSPMHIFSKSGFFNPMLPHRRSRILRRHIYLFDFLHRALLSPEVWLEQSEAQRKTNTEKALDLWYEK